MRVRWVAGAGARSARRRQLHAGGEIFAAAKRSMAAFSSSSMAQDLPPGMTPGLRFSVDISLMPATCVSFTSSPCRFDAAIAASPFRPVRAP